MVGYRFVNPPHAASDRMGGKAAAALGRSIGPDPAPRRRENPPGARASLLPASPRAPGRSAPASTVRRRHRDASPSFPLPVLSRVLLVRRQRRIGGRARGQSRGWRGSAARVSPVRGWGMIQGGRRDCDPGILARRGVILPAELAKCLLGRAVPGTLACAAL